MAERGVDADHTTLNRRVEKYEQQPSMGLAIRKYTLATRGVISHETLRLPGGVLSKESQKEIDRLNSRQEKRLKELG